MSSEAFKLAAGELRHRVHIQTAAETRDAQGGVTQTWGNVAERWAVVRPISGNEKTNAMQIAESVTHRIVLRWYDGLTTDMRILFGTRQFHLVNILNIEERNKLQVCLAIEVQAVPEQSALAWNDAETMGWNQ